MNELESDWDLLRAYVDHGSQEAFSQLVQRHLTMVYSACYRQVGKGHLAEEATQAVFIVLARKGRSLHDGVVLSSWLYRTARFTALNALKMETRRRIHERRAAEMAAEFLKVDSSWHRLEPLLDEGVATLGERERAAIVLRFFEHRSLKEIGQAIGTTEAGAGMRLSRALEKLREFFQRRGVALQATALGGVLWSDSLRTVPPTLHDSVCRSAFRVARQTGPGSSIDELAHQAMRTAHWAKTRALAAMCVGIAATLILGFCFFESMLTRPRNPGTSPGQPISAYMDPDAGRRQ